MIFFCCEKIVQYGNAQEKFRQHCHQQLLTFQHHHHHQLLKLENLWGITTHQVRLKWWLNQLLVWGLQIVLEKMEVNLTIKTSVFLFCSLGHRLQLQNSATTQVLFFLLHPCPHHRPPLYARELF
jgi:hypothetical protein